MVAQEAPSPLPSLSPEDSAQISRLIELGEDLFALAKETNRDFCTLLAWTLRPDIAPWLDTARAARDRQHIQLARTALAELAHTPDPVEKRRAASTLLRAFTRQWPSSPARGSGGGLTRSVPERAPSPAAGGGGVMRSMTEGVPSFLSSPPARQPSAPDLTLDPTDDEELDRELDRFADGEDWDEDEDPAPDEPAHAKHSGLSTQHSGPLSPLPSGTPTPAAHLEAHHISEAVLRALQDPQLPVPDAYKHTLYTLAGYNPAERTQRYLDHIADTILIGAPGILHFQHCTPGPIIPLEAGWARQHCDLTTLDGRRLTLELAFRKEHNPHHGHAWILKHLRTNPTTPHQNTS